jgi:glucose/arabinose dehydrogenase
MICLRILVVLFLTFFFAHHLNGQIPAEFEFSQVTNQIPGAVTADFAANGNIYVSDFAGRVWLIQDGVLNTTPVLDISEEVGGYGELGCLGFALHPDFMLNGYFYLLYVVDRHHLLYYGTPDYDPAANLYDQATMGRLTRFQVQLNDYYTIIPESRTVLYGSQIGTGNPVVTLSHGTGDIVFGTDGTLMFSTGDGNTWVNYFAGGDQPVPVFAYDTQALADGILSPQENVGSFRAQQIDSYSGKILRIDPMTGEGIPGNPFYDENDPNSARSKVWALGLRNPYRMTLKPGSGSNDQALANPGTLYITDVGYNQWEEINVCDGPGYNFGWPLYEGMHQNPGYFGTYRKNFFSPNPLANSNCTHDYFSFQQLLIQENAQHNYFFPNPCNPQVNIASNTIVHTHIRPALAYRNAANGGSDTPEIPGFNDFGVAIGIPISDAEAGVEQAEIFNGIAGMTGDFYDGQSYPEGYLGILPVLDYMGWLKVFWFDENHEVYKMEHWLSGLTNTIDMRYNPNDECYYMIKMYPSEISKLCFTGNLSPIVHVTPNPPYGPSPLQVFFDTEGTYDPEGDPLTFEWNFGDGNFSAEIAPTHTYIAPSSDPYTLEAMLTVSDTAGNSVVRNMLISLNNSPPMVNITSIVDGTLYAMNTPTQYALQADVFDEEHSVNELQFSWDTFLHHNLHFHAVSSNSSVESSFALYPVGCGEIDSYYYRIALTVTDPEGLFGYDEVNLFPDCEGTLGGSIEYAESFTLFPNPTTGQVTLGLDSLWQNENVQISVFDATGRAILSQNFQFDNSLKTLTFNFEALSAGFYVLLAESPNFRHTKRFLRIKP